MKNEVRPDKYTPSRGQRGLNYIVFLLLIVSIAGQAWAQVEMEVPAEVEAQVDAEDAETRCVSMFTLLTHDYFSSDSNRKEKRQCYARYAQLLLTSLHAQVSSPFEYIRYYRKRDTITALLRQFYNQRDLENYEHVGQDILDGLVNPNDLRRFMGERYYRLWLYGDTEDPLGLGGLPDDYMPKSSTAFRRWCYSGVRNARWNATYINNYTAPVVSISTPFDNRSHLSGKNFGTGNTRLGAWLRWYVDEEGRWWYFYENTRRTGKHSGKLVYFGTVTLGQYPDGEYPTKKRGRFELSLNRSVAF